jgi:lysophospholipase L1-like esterase
MSSTLKNVVNLFMILILGLVIGLALFWFFSSTGVYEKLRRGEVTLMTIQEALPVLYVADPDVGRKLRPLTKIHFRTASFDTTTITNRDGFTGRDYSLETNNYRVAIIGDSFVEAYGVDDRSRFPWVTERLVYEKTDGKLKLEVMGFGVSGWGTAHAYGAIKKYVLKYKPNEIWLAFLPTNDFGDNSPLLNGPPYGPTYVYKSAGSDEIIDIKFGYSDIPVALQKERERRYGADNIRDSRANWDYGHLPFYWSSEANPYWDMIEDHTMQTLKLIKELCVTEGIKLSLVYRTSPYDDPEEFNNFREKVADHLGRELPMSRELALSRFKAKVEALNIDFINTLDMMDAGIKRKADESDASAHLRTASFFSDILIERVAPQMLRKD